MMMILVEAIHSLRPNAIFTISGRSYDGLEWLDETQTKPTREEVEAEMNRLQVIYDNNEYQRLREPEYPPIKDQLDMLYHDKINGTDNWLQAIQAVKDKYPKP